MITKQTVNTAILLAAGRGARLKPYTDKTPKPLLPYHGKPTLDHVFEGIAKSGISKVVVITHHLEDQIEQWVMQNAERHGLTAALKRQSVLDGTASAVEAALEAEPTWFDSPFLITATDYLVGPTFYDDLVTFHTQHQQPVSISLKAVPEEELGSRSSVRYTEPYHITEVVEKPPAGKAPSKLAANLIYIVPPAISTLVANVQPSPRGEREFQSAVNVLLADGTQARGLLQPTPSEWTPPEGATNADR